MCTVVGLTVGALLLGASFSYAASLSGTVTIAGKQAEGAVVFLESVRESALPPGSTQVVMDQRDLKFVPAVLPVVRGTAVNFTNSDDLQHNVFSPSTIAGKFDLGTYGHGEKRRITFNTPGDVVVLCNIHMEMEAHILVLKDPYFATVAQDGQYHIAEVPPGTYTLRVWQKRLLPVSQTLEVPATGSLTLNLQLER